MTLAEQVNLINCRGTTTWRHDNSPNDYKHLDGWERGRLKHDVKSGKMEVYGTMVRFGEIVALVRNVT